MTDKHAKISIEEMSGGLIIEGRFSEDNFAELLAKAIRMIASKRALELVEKAQNRADASGGNDKYSHEERAKMYNGSHVVALISTIKNITSKIEDNIFDSKMKNVLSIISATGINPFLASSQCQEGAGTLRQMQTESVSHGVDIKPADGGVTVETSEKDNSTIEERKPTMGFGLN